MEQNKEYYTSAAGLFQFWNRQPFGDRPETQLGNLSGALESALYFYSQGQQFVYVYDYMLGGIAFVAQNIRNVLGYAPEDVGPEFFYRKMHPADHDQVLKISRAFGDLVLQHKEIAALTVFQTVDCRLQHADGHYIKMQRQTSILKRDELGNIRFSLGIFTDIAHLHRGAQVSFDISVPEYKEVMLEILASYDPAFVPVECSSREKQVLRLMALGNNTRQIAQELSISTFTVDTHRKNMKRKLKARNTAELITTAFTRKIIQ
jgi:DNA-binding CsgD family transcriptional regulator